MSCREKTISISEIMLPNQANVAGNVHGGVIMHMMDTAAWTAAIKYARSQAVTARVDELQFHRPVLVGNLVTCTATIAYVGNTTMEVKVTTQVEDLLGDDPEPQIALTGFFTMVAMGKDGKPCKVEPLCPVTEEEIKLHNEGEARRAYYKQRLTK
jgi:uncharacterized protein (TIGR00369 family)